MIDWVIGVSVVGLFFSHVLLSFRVSSIESRMAKESTFISVADDPRGVIDNVSRSVQLRVFEELASNAELKRRIVESINDMQLDRGQR